MSSKAAQHVWRQLCGFSETPPADVRNQVEWRKAAKVYQRETRNDTVTKPDIGPLTEDLYPLRDRVGADKVFRDTFGCEEWEIAFINLEQAIAYQTYVNWSYVGQLRAEIGTNPDPTRLFDFCLVPTYPPIEVGEITRWTGQVSSLGPEATILEYFECPPADIPREKPVLGKLMSFLVLGLGYQHNCLSAILASNRLVIMNGTHRACALYGLNLKLVPCVVRRLPNLDELPPIPYLQRNKAILFAQRRPPMVKDFFNPALYRERAKPAEKRILRFFVEEAYEPL
jgi:hypothetical protein